jgi:hypothetical protein
MDVREMGWKIVAWIHLAQDRKWSCFRLQVKEWTCAYSDPLQRATRSYRERESTSRPENQKSDL